MTKWKSFGGTVAIAALMGGTAAMADVTASEVWADWQGYMEGVGYRVSYDRSMSGDTLTINDLVFSFDLPEDSGTLVFDLGSIAFQNLANGTVSVLMPEEMPIGVNVGEEVSLILDYGQGDLSMVVSGSPDEMTYSYSASQIVLGVDNLMVEGDRIDDAVLELTLQNVHNKTVSSPGDVRRIDNEFSSDLLTYKMLLVEPGGDGFKIDIAGSLTGLGGSSKSAIPQDMDFEQLGAALDAGFAGRGDLTWGAGGYEISVVNGRDAFEGSSTSTSGSLNFNIDREALGYGVTVAGVKSSFSGSEIPLPSVDYEIGEAIFSLLMPLAKSDTPSDFAMTMKLGDFSISDGIWGLVDPTAILSREPATILVDLVGKANWLVDIMDPESVETMGAEMPGQLHALTLKGLQVKMVGADLTGAGDFTFDNNDLTTFDGMPKPTGALDLKIVGANGLMDNLVAMGLLPEDQVMGFRMMMGLFAVVSESEEDTLTSKIEINEEGHVLANGQRLQ